MRHRALLLFVCALAFGLAAVALSYQALNQRPNAAPVVAEAPPPPPAPPVRASLSSMIGGERRAITIRVNDVLGVGGFVLPGDRVDVLLTRSAANEIPATDILLQNVKVLGIDQEASDKKEAPMVARAVTLEVSAEEAQRITLGTQVGTLSLALRNLADTAESARPRTIGLNDLRPNAPIVRVHGGGNIGASVRVLRGTAASDSPIVPER